MSCVGFSTTSAGIVEKGEDFYEYFDEDPGVRKPVEIVVDDRSGKCLDQGGDSISYRYFFELPVLNTGRDTDRVINKQLVAEKDFYFANYRLAPERFLTSRSYYNPEYTPVESISITDLYLDDNYFSVSLIHYHWFDEMTDLYESLALTFDRTTGEQLTLPEFLNMSSSETMDFVWKRISEYKIVTIDKSAFYQRNANKISYCIAENGNIYVLSSKYEYASGAAGSPQFYLTSLPDEVSPIYTLHNNSVKSVRALTYAKELLLFQRLNLSEEYYFTRQLVSYDKTESKWRLKVKVYHYRVGEHRAESLFKEYYIADESWRQEKT